MKMTMPCECWNVSSELLAGRLLPAASRSDQQLFQRFRVRQVARRLAVQQRDELRGSGGGARGGFHDDVFGIQLLGVEDLIGPAIGAERGTFVRDAGDQSAVARV